MPRGRREVADRLIAPAAVERMLADRHQLDVGEVGVLQVRDQLVGQLAVVEEAVARPRASASTSRGGPRRSPSARRVPCARSGGAIQSSSPQANLVTSQTIEAVLGRSSAANP